MPRSRSKRRSSSKNRSKSRSSSKNRQARRRSSSLSLQQLFSSSPFRSQRSRARNIPKSTYGMSSLSGSPLRFSISPSFKLKSVYKKGKNKSKSGNSRSSRSSRSSPKSNKSSVQTVRSLRSSPGLQFDMD
jgi:hypothetical protein